MIFKQMEVNSANYPTDMLWVHRYTWWWICKVKIEHKKFQ